MLNMNGQMMYLDNRGICFSFEEGLNEIYKEADEVE